jgi:hypothetical protein
VPRYEHQPDNLAAVPAFACSRCGYDLRATPADGRCPECGQAVAVSAEVAKLPIRPAWHESDPRWRRNVLLGLWVLTLLPLPTVLRETGVAARLRIPALFEPGSWTRPLEDSHLYLFDPALTFFIGTMLLLTPERGRRHHWTDRLRPWAIIANVILLGLTIANHSLVHGLVLTGIAGSLTDVPLQYQP